METPKKPKHRLTQNTPTKATPKSQVKTIRSPKKKVVLVPTPRKKKQVKQYDRFIPDRATMNMATSQFNLKNQQKEYLDRQQIEYQHEIGQACQMALDQRVLQFNVEPPQVKPVNHLWAKKQGVQKKKRRIPLIPEKVLDAPGLVDDYYLNVLDWSSRNLLAVGLDKSVYIWNADDGSVQEFMTTADDDYVSSIEWAQDGSYLAIGLGSGDAQIWDVDTFTKIRSMRGHTARVGVLSWDKHILSSGARDGSVWNHDVRIAKHKVQEWMGHTGEVCGLEWRPDGQLLASGGNDNLVQIWDARSSVPKHTKTNHMAAVKALAWCPWQLNLLATGGGKQDNMIHFWNTSNDTKVASVNTGSQVTSIQWSREYKEFISSHGFPSNHLSIWSYPSLNKITDLPGHDARILSTSLSPDGQTVASSASDENLKFWKVFESNKKSKELDLEQSMKRMTIR